MNMQVINSAFSLTLATHTIYAYAAFSGFVSACVHFALPCLVFLPCLPSQLRCVAVCPRGGHATGGQGNGWMVQPCCAHYAISDFSVRRLRSRLYDANMAHEQLLGYRNNAYWCTK